MKKLNIENCIIKSDAIKIQQEPPVKKVKTRLKLCKEIHRSKVFKELSLNGIYTKLRRFELDGYEQEKEPTELIDSVIEVLNSGLYEKVVTREDLIKQ